MEKINIITEIIGDILEGIIPLIAYMALSGNRDFIKLNKAKTVIFSLMYGFFCFWAFVNIPGGFHTLFIAIFAVLLLNYITGSGFYASFITLVVCFVIYAITEAVVIATFSNIFKVGLKDILEIPKMRIMAVFITKALQFSVIGLLYYKKIRIFRENIIEKKNSVLAYPLSQSGFVLFAVFIPQYFLKDQNLMNGVLLAVILLLYFAFSYFDYKDRDKMLTIQNKFLTQVEYVKNLETVIDVIRKEKHDFDNHLNTLMALCSLKRNDSLEKVEAYLQNLTRSNSSAYKFYNTGNNYIDGLLAVKSNYAYENGISFDVDFEAPLSIIDAEDIALTSIIGNIIDNAFDAVNLNNENKGRIVSVYSYRENGSLLLAISNNGPMIPDESIEKIFENGFSTKTGKDRNEHGYGLYITKQLVEKFKGRISIVSSEENTEFLIEFQAVNSKNEIDKIAS